MIAVGVLGSLGDELDPVLDLGHPGIHAVAGALAPIAHHTNLGESKYTQRDRKMRKCVYQPAAGL